MELLAPAGNIEKLTAAYQYGADAAYAGIDSFSLRARADNFDLEDAAAVAQLKAAPAGRTAGGAEPEAPAGPGGVPATAPPEAAGDAGRTGGDPPQGARLRGARRLYCALNVYFHDADLARLEERIEALAAFPFDAFIVSDIGVLSLLRRYAPHVQWHLSTQANCVNAEAARFYRDLGFSRIIPGRELSLREIEGIRTAVPEVELEVFVHGAMCLAYSGRCFLSAWMTGRSANRGDCAHSCRWKYRPADRLYFLEEAKRQGEFYPALEGENFTSILSSKDIRMIDHLGELRDAGVDGLKIEGRMKSSYYTAVVTRAYRKQLDHVLHGTPSAEEAADYTAELDHVSRREPSTGFYFSRENVEQPTEREYQRDYTFLGIIGPQAGPNTFELVIKNQIRRGMHLEVLGPDLPSMRDEAFELTDEEGTTIDRANHGTRAFIRPGVPVAPGYMLRTYRPDAPN
ncbi:MAG: U32 family peptidase C-terminal domain-containing protein [Spirochaetia bacterium]